MTPQLQLLNKHFNSRLFRANFHWILTYSLIFTNNVVGLKSLLNLNKFVTTSPKQLKVKYSQSTKFRVKAPQKVTDSELNHTWYLFKVYQQAFLNNPLPDFAPHPHFRPFFIFDRGKKPLYLNYKKTYSRWVNTYNLLLNLFLKQLKPLMFMTKSFRSEVRAFNWSATTWDYTFFKRVTPYFCLQETQHGHVTNYIFNELIKNNSLFSIITDIKYHEKNTHFLKRFGGYTIGVTPLNTSPWLVSYPIIVGAGTVLVEYFFLSLISFIRQYAEVIHYNELVFLWKLL